MVENPQASLLPAQRTSFWHMLPNPTSRNFHNSQMERADTVTLGLSNHPSLVKHFLLLLAP